MSNDIRDNAQIKAAIIKHLKRNLKTRSGMFSNRQGDLRMWFEQHLDDIIPMAFGPKGTKGRDIVNIVFVSGRSVQEVVDATGYSKSTVYSHIDTFFLSLVDELPEDLFNKLSHKAAELQMWRNKACTQCNGDMYFDDVGGVISRDSEWCCIACGHREPHETRRK